MASAAGGAWGMRYYIRRKRVIAEAEDPRDTQIRDLLARVKVATDTADRERAATETATSQLGNSHREIEKRDAEIADAVRQYTTCKDVLKKEIAAKNDIRDRLKITEQQLENYKQQLHEAQMELRVKHASEELLDPSLQTGAPIDDEEIPPLAESTVDGNRPSLIQELTDELDRWKRNCHVLGDELKTQRHQNQHRAQSDDGPPADELTAIRGIGSVMERKLHELGVYRYRELVALNQQDIQRAALLIPDLERRMERFAWREQAKSLHMNKYNDAI